MPFPWFVEHQASSVEQDLPGQYLRGPSWMTRAMKPKQCLRKGGVEEKPPSQGEMSWVQRARWTTSPQLREEGSLRGMSFPRGRRTEEGYKRAPSKLLSCHERVGTDRAREGERNAPPHGLSNSLQQKVTVTLHSKLTANGCYSQYRG